MKQFFLKTQIIFCILWAGKSIVAQNNNCYPPSIFVPRQLSYNPILENALVLHERIDESWNYIFSCKPLYQQNVGSKFNKYFTIDNKSTLDVAEDGSGDISSLWFTVISSDTTFYNSTLSFCPKTQTFGSMLYFAIQLPAHVTIAVNTALVAVRNDIHLREYGQTDLGTVSGFSTITSSFANCDRLFGRVYTAQTKVGLDDIQVKCIYNPYSNDSGYFDMYALLGIPTGSGSKGIFLFEPLVGSNHVQLGAGANGEWCMTNKDFCTCFLLAEAKYRYAFKAKEYRSFDLTDNGAWSRYMLFVNNSNTFNSYPAINDLTFKADVTPQSSFDAYVALNFERHAWNIEIGYDFWYRSTELLSVHEAILANVGIADLKGIANTNPQSASTANISQAVAAGNNQMTSDSSFVPVTINDLALTSGAQPKSMSNSMYLSVGHTFDVNNYVVQLGINAAYERGINIYTPDNILTWAHINIYF